jgi:hypothetical protein
MRVSARGTCCKPNEKIAPSRQTCHWHFFERIASVMRSVSAAWQKAISIGTIDPPLFFASADFFDFLLPVGRAAHNSTIV